MTSAPKLDREKRPYKVYIRPIRSLSREDLRSGSRRAYNLNGAGQPTRLTVAECECRIYGVQMRTTLLHSALAPVRLEELDCLMVDALLTWMTVLYSSSYASRTRTAEYHQEQRTSINILRAERKEMSELEAAVAHR